MDIEYVEAQSNSDNFINHRKDCQDPLDDDNKEEQVQNEVRVFTRAEENMTGKIEKGRIVEDMKQEKPDCLKLVDEFQKFRNDDKKQVYLDDIKQEEVEIKDTVLGNCNSLNLHNSSEVASESLNNELKQEEKIKSEENPVRKKPRTGGKQYQCKECGYNSRSAANLRVHSRIHTGERPYKCTQCDYRATQRTALQQHIRTHTGERPFKCSKCDYSAITTGALKLHSYIHSEDKPFKCAQCSYSTIAKCNLETHVKLHSGDRPFVCNLCWYETTNERCLKQHNLIHTDNKPFKCTECSYGTRQRCDLESHTRSHRGEKPFECDLCEFKCTKKAYLKTHIQTRHHYKFNYEKTELPKIKPRSKIRKSDQLTFSFKF